MKHTDGKRQNILLLWEILKEETDETHKLTINQILKLFSEKIDPDIEESKRKHPDRKTIAANIDNLIKMGYPISTGKITEKKGNGEHLTKVTSKTYYYNNKSSKSKELTDAQLFILADSVFAANFLKDDEADEIAEWVFRHGTKTFRDTYSKERIADYGKPARDTELFEVIEKFNKAECDNKQMKFDYYEFNLEGKIMSKEQDIERDIVINPYYTVISNGYYYLVGYVEAEKQFKHYRIDKIRYSKVCKERRLAIEDIDPDFKISNYKCHNIDMTFDSNNVGHVTLKVKNDFLHFIYDNLGKDDIRSSSKHDGYVEMMIIYSLDKVRAWALLHSDKIEVIEPQSLRREICDIANNVGSIYN